MRDAHRMKDRQDLTLDGSRLTVLVLGGLLALGAAFYFGVSVGKRAAAREHAPEAPDLLTALDRRSAALEQARKDPPLTFQDELTRKMPEPSAPAPSVTKDALKVGLALGDAGPGAGAGAALGEGAVDSAPTPVRTAPAAANAQALHHPPETVPNGLYTLQLGASPNKEDADRQAARLRDRGYAPYIVKATVPGKGTFYRVRMGSFASKDAAMRYLQDFRRETQLEAIVALTKP